LPKRQPSSNPTWKDVKAVLIDFDRPGLLALIQDMYSAHSDTKAFLHTRFDLGGDILKPYKKIIERWLWPGMGQDVSIVKAKEAISRYSKAVGSPSGLAELLVFYCECATGFCNDVGYQENSYFNTLVRMFEQALHTAAQLSPAERSPLIARLDKVRAVGHNLGYGIDFYLDSLFAEYADQ